MPEAFRSTTMAAVAVLGTVLSAPASAQGKLDARYAVTLAGIPIGKGAWVVDIADDQFTAAASGTTTGLLQVISHGLGTGATRAILANGKQVSATFAASITADKKTEEIRVSVVGGTVKDFSVIPPPTPHSERVPVTDEHRHGVIDPMSSALYKVPGQANLFGPEACPRYVPVFDGRMRYDLRLSFKRVERVKAERGYEGPAVVCAVYFSPIAGHVPTRYAIKYLTQQRDIEAWLVPVAGTRVMVPFRLSIPTPLGTGVMQATQFITSAQPPRAATTRTQ